MGNAPKSIAYITGIGSSAAELLVESQWRLSRSGFRQETRLFSRALGAGAICGSGGCAWGDFISSPKTGPRITLPKVPEKI